MWTPEEDEKFLRLVEKYGKRWSKIASHLPGRTDNGVRNRWNRMEKAHVQRAQNGAVGSSRTLMRPGRREHSNASTIATPTERVAQEGCALCWRAQDKQRPGTSVGSRASLRQPPS